MNDDYIKAYNKGVIEGKKHCSMSPETRREIDKIKKLVWFFIGASCALILDSLIHTITYGL